MLVLNGKYVVLLSSELCSAWDLQPTCHPFEVCDFPTLMINTPKMCAKVIILSLTT